MSAPGSYLWLDYETTGLHRAFDRPVQFGAIRTDANLEPIGEPINLLCGLSTDSLPSPHSSLIHGIGPVTQNREGMPEAEFAAEVFAQMNQPGTCNVGYNNIRFDDEFSRHLFHRNLREPYTFHYANDCTRWDMLDVARACRALTPQGMEWPFYDDGRASYRMDDILTSNGFEFKAHDALEDAIATLELAKHMRTCQPRFFEWALQMRETRFVEKMLSAGEPLVLISGLMPPQQKHAALVLPLGKSSDAPRNWIAAHLHEPDEAFTPQGLTERYEAESPFKPASLIRSNRCPMLAPLSVLRDGGRAKELGLDVRAQLERAERLRAIPDLRDRLAKFYRNPPREEGAAVDSDESLYSGSFASNKDRQLFKKLCKTPPQEMLSMTGQFENPAYADLLFRHVARNWPESLSEDEQQVWRQQCHTRLHDGPGRTFDTYRQELQEVTGNAPEPLLQELEQWEQRVSQWLEA